MPVGVSAQGLQKPNTAPGNGSRALKYSLFKPQGEAFTCPPCERGESGGWDGASLLPFHTHYPAPGGGRRKIRPHFVAALGQRPPRAGRMLFGCGRQAALGQKIDSETGDQGSETWRLTGNLLGIF